MQGVWGGAPQVTYRQLLWRTMLMILIVFSSYRVLGLGSWENDLRVLGRRITSAGTQFFLLESR